jgi:hypothetical protein
MSDEETINNLKNEISELKVALAVEKTRSKIFKDLVTSNTNIKFKESISRRTIIPDIDIIIEPEPIPIEPLTESKQSIEIDIVNKEIDDMFDRVKTAKTFTKTVNDIQKKRVSLMAITPIDKFKLICKDHIYRLSVIFTEKGFSDKKIESQITKALSSIEMRLLKHPGYFNSHIDVDDKQNLVRVLESQQNTNMKNTPFKTTDIAASLMNYGSVLVNMKTNLQRIVNSSNNIIYVDKPTSSKTDPFSFYTLSSSDDKKMNWVMDCRLEELTTSIRDDILPFLISTFKELYFDVFGDNVYRKDYKNRCPLTECDCQQLLTNIYTISSNNTLNTILKNIVRDSSTHIPIKGVDKFNISSDDPMQKQRWKAFCDESNECARLLFDEISNEDVVEFEKIFSTKY